MRYGIGDADQVVFTSRMMVLNGAKDCAVVRKVGGAQSSKGSPMVSRSRFEQLVLTHRNDAYNLAYWILQSRDDAEDAVQDAYMRAFRAFDTFEGNDARPWLLAIVRNVAYSAFSARKRSRNVIGLMEDSKQEKRGGAEAAIQDPSPEAIAINQQEHKLLLEALAGLSPVQRDILVLREMEGLSYKDIANVMGIEIGTVMSRLSRARAEIRRVLQRRTDHCHVSMSNGSLGFAAVRRRT